MAFLVAAALAVMGAAFLFVVGALAGICALSWLCAGHSE